MEREDRPGRGEYPRIFIAQAAYDTGRQVNNGMQPNPKGRDRYLAGAGYIRLPWRLPSMESFLGFGWRWNQLSTTRHTKDADRPQVGGGFDYWQRTCPTCRPNFSMRLGLDWVLVGSDWLNAVRGPEINISIPSLREPRHFFFAGTLGIYGPIRRPPIAPTFSSCGHSVPIAASSRW